MVNNNDTAKNHCKNGETESFDLMNYILLNCKQSNQLASLSQLLENQFRDPSKETIGLGASEKVEGLR